MKNKSHIIEDINETKEMQKLLFKSYKSFYLNPKRLLGRSPVTRNQVN